MKELLKSVALDIKSHPGEFLKDALLPAFAGRLVKNPLTPGIVKGAILGTGAYLMGKDLVNFLSDSMTNENLDLLRKNIEMANPCSIAIPHHDVEQMRLPISRQATVTPIPVTESVPSKIPISENGLKRAGRAQNIGTFLFEKAYRPHRSKYDKQPALSHS